MDCTSNVSIQNKDKEEAEQEMKELGPVGGLHFSDG